MKLTGIREKVFKDRYSLKDAKGDPIENTPEKMWHRVAKAIAQVEKQDIRRQHEKDFNELMKDFKFIPGGRILSGAGGGYEVTYYNCFVIPSPKDSRDGILDTLKHMVEIMARGGGVGFNISSLRPRGARVNKVNGYSSGPINWAELFSVTTKDIIQQGGTRRGALMLMLHDWHPDIEEFITVKQDFNKINGANLSVAISDDFMAAVEKDSDWDLCFPDVKDPEYDEKWHGDMTEWKKLGKKVNVFRTVKARKIWDMIAEAAWKSAEPGVVFLERYNKQSNNHYFERLHCVNPCGEQGLPDWGVCNLGSLNLAAFVKNSKMDYDKLYTQTKIALRFLDDVIDASHYFYKTIEETQLDRRRTGLGTMGLADALIKMKVRYGSNESLKVIEKIYKAIRDAAYEASVDLAKEKGAFSRFDKVQYMKGKFIKELPEKLQQRIAKYGIRNSVLLTQAPTGSTSLLTGVSSGIEPVFEFAFTRHDRLGEHKIYHQLYEEWMKKTQNLKNSQSIKKPDYFVSASELTPEEHIRVQAVIQQYTDSSISKTVNAPNDHTVEDVKRIYSLAYKLGCKGLTYFRDGSRAGVLEREVAPKPVEKPVEEKPVHPVYIIKPRPAVVHGSTYRMNTPVGAAFITINTNGGMEPLEVFINIGKAGSDVYAMAEGLGRVISLALRFSSHLSPTERIREVAEQLADIGGARVMGFGKDRIRSLPDAVSKVLSMHYGLNGQAVKEKTIEIEEKKEISQVVVVTQESLPMDNIDNHVRVSGRKYDLCPKCGEASVVNEEGCKKCYNCGSAEC